MYTTAAIKFWQRDSKSDQEQHWNHISGNATWVSSLEDTVLHVLHVHISCVWLRSFEPQNFSSQKTHFWKRPFWKQPQLHRDSQPRHLLVLASSTCALRIWDKTSTIRAPSRGPIWSKVTAVLSRWLSPRSQRQEPVVSSRSRCVFLPKLMSETLRQRSKFSCWSFRTSFVHSLLASEGLMDNLFAGRSPRIIAFAPCVFTFAEAFQFNIAVSNPCRLITTPPPYIGVLEPSSIRAENFGNTMIRGENGENSFRRENIFCCFLQAMPRQCAASKACAVAVCDEAFSCAGCAPPIPCPIPRSKVTGVLSRFLCKNSMFWKTAARACFSDPCASTSWFSCTEHFFTFGGKKKCEKSHSHSQSLTRSEPTFLWARNVL